LSTSSLLAGEAEEDNKVVAAVREDLEPEQVYL
jgi:hypothetical protein